ncbi:MAG: GNAT family N-acetyltransferase [Longimicrobiales bacterium]|nr:GNAT family N-acetyltransferase [Longimicrobiales bacterium]
MVGPEEEEAAATDLWAATHPVRARLEMRMGIYALEAVTPPRRAAPGRMRAARPDEWMALTPWMEGSPVAMAGVSGTTPHGARVGYVYTPPDRRGRGYAGALTAALSRRLLEGGRRFCFLYTNLADPVSNRIYRRLGYGLVTRAAAYRFDER